MIDTARWTKHGPARRLASTGLACGIILALTVTPTATAAELHVPTDFSTIQACINAATDGDECIVAPGTYNELIDFHGKAITLRSSNGPEVTIIDAGPVAEQPDGKPVIRCGTGGDPGTVLEGFTITGGTGATGDTCGFDPTHRCGGGMYNRSSTSPTVTHCVFAGNSADFGAGMYNRFSSPSVTHCTFIENVADFNGGGMYNTHLSRPTVTDCFFTGNQATSLGGGMYNDVLSDATVTNCAFSGNSAVGDFARGGGIFNDASSPTVEHCSFSENFASFGGAMYNFSSSSPMVTRCTISGNWAWEHGGGIYNDQNSNAAVTNCAFLWNTAAGNFGCGGGIANSTSHPVVTNCTFVQNWASYTGGGMFTTDDFFGHSTPSLANCIFWDNGPDQIADVLGALTTVTYSDVQGGWPGEGNIDADPLFVDLNGEDNIPGTPDDRVQLSHCLSPCVDAGDNAAVPVGAMTDLDGNPRFFDDKGIVDTGNGTPPLVDMGAFERQQPSGAQQILVPAERATIRAAIDAACDGDEVIVAPGTYNELIDFMGKAITLRSSHGPEMTIIDAGPVAGTRKPVVRCDTGEGPDTILDGFTLTGGTGAQCLPSLSITCGGGMFNKGASPTVRHCLFVGNSADFGGGMYNRDGSSPIVTGCSFKENASIGNSGHGGGMRNFNASHPTLTNCTFSQNTSLWYGGGMANSSSSPILANCTFSENTSLGDGGGMANVSSSPTVTNCTFSENSAFSGGGIANHDSSNLGVTHCTFIGNAANSIGGGMRNSASSPTVTDSTFNGNSSAFGGGMYNGGSGTTVTSCTFTGNSAIGDFGRGGGMYNGTGSSIVTNCTFSGNSANDSGGGMVNEAGTATIVNCTFSENEAVFGGGLCNNSDSTVIGCLFSANTAAVGGGMCNNNNSSLVANCTFSGNTGDLGGGIMNQSSSPTLMNCTFSGNTAGVGNGGGMFNFSSVLVATNCVLWGNAPDPIVDEAGAVTTISYSDVQGTWPGVGNIDADPMYVRNPSDGGDGWGDDPDTPDVDEGANDDFGDLRLLFGSPGIDAGSNTALPPDTLDLDGDGDTFEPMPFDLDGHARVLCDVVDMGAYESGIGDDDCDGDVDLDDFAAYFDCRTGPAGGLPMGCAPFDFDGDGSVDLVDVAGFQRAFAGSP